MSGFLSAQSQSSRSQVQRGTQVSGIPQDTETEAARHWAHNPPEPISEPSHPTRDTLRVNPEPALSQYQRRFGHFQLVRLLASLFVPRTNYCRCNLLPQQMEGQGLRSIIDDCKVQSSFSVFCLLLKRHRTYLINWRCDRGHEGKVD